MKKLLSFFIIFQILSTLTMQSQEIKRRFVKENAMGDGTSWSNASSDLQAMINESSAGDEIWVSSGTYKPIRPANKLDEIDSNNRDNAFVLKADVNIYGGFKGSETNIYQRPDNSPFNENQETVSILSGDIGNPFDNTDNCYHVVISVGDVGTACLDGFTITDGNANSNNFIIVNSLSIYRYSGGGMVNVESSPTINNTTIKRNDANMQGGGIYNFGGYYGSSPILTNVAICENNAKSEGGGIYNNSSSPQLTHVSICGNTAKGISSFGDGGGIFNYNFSSPKLSHVTISENSASMQGGGISNKSYCSLYLFDVFISKNTAVFGGGIFNQSSLLTTTNVIICGNNAIWFGGGLYNSGCEPTFSNLLISGNNADRDGGGIYNSLSSPTLTNSTISGNIAKENGGGVCNESSSTPNIFNSIIWGNTSGTTNIVSNVININHSNTIYSNSLVGGVSSTEVNDVDPLFVDPISAAIAPTSEGNYSLRPNSPAIDAGNNIIYLTTRSIVDFSDETDLAGNPRLSGSSIDIGAYEYQQDDTDNVIVTGVTLSLTSLNLQVGQTQQLTETVLPSNATNKAVTWSSSNPSVANISSSGLVTADTEGTTTITVTTQDGNYHTTCMVTVLPSTVTVTGVSVIPTSANLQVGQTQQLIETVFPSNATNKAVTWSSSNPSVASVSSSGLVTADTEGTATIYVTTQDGDYQATSSIAVSINTGIESITQKEIKIYCSNVFLVVQNVTEKTIVEVYNFNGSLYYKVEIFDEKNIPLPKGVYIVKAIPETGVGVVKTIIVQ